MYLPLHVNSQTEKKIFFLRMVKEGETCIILSQWSCLLRETPQLFLAVQGNYYFAKFSNGLVRSPDLCNLLWRRKKTSIEFAK